MSEMSADNGLAAQWKALLQLHGLYTALAREFVLELPPCHELEDGEGESAPSQQTVEMACQWVVEVDEQVSVHQLRQFLQSSRSASQENLEALLRHYLRKAGRGAADRDKIDFLLVQFFSQHVPSQLTEAETTPDYVAQILQPVLETADSTVPPALQELDEVVLAAERCGSLNDLLSSGTLEKGRVLKASPQVDYFTPAAMIAFTRFNFRMRKLFFRLMHQDLNAILEGLRELEACGVEQLDCRAADFSAHESVARLRMICQSWKAMFLAEYSSGQPLRTLVDLRAVVDTARQRKAGENPAGVRTHAATAGPGGSED